MEALAQTVLSDKGAMTASFGHGFDPRHGLSNRRTCL